MVVEIEMLFDFRTKQDRVRMRIEQKEAMAHYELVNGVTLVVKSDTAKHVVPKNGQDFWRNITILEVYNIHAR